MSIKKVLSFAKKNYLPLIFISIIGFVGLVGFYKLFLKKPTYVYVKVKVGQGLWWAATGEPSHWMVSGIKRGMVEHDFLDKPIAEILSKEYYPLDDPNHYSIYLTLRLKVSSGAKGYIYNRSSLAIGSPVDFTFPTAQFSGTVLAISRQNFQGNFADRIVTLTKRNAYPWEYDAIHVGENYFDGQQTVFTILDKKAVDTSVLSSDAYGNTTANISDPMKYITVQAKVRVKKENGLYVFGEEQLLRKGRGITLSLPTFTFYGYVVADIQHP